MGPYQGLGYTRIKPGLNRPSRSNLAREKFTEETLSWQPRKRLRRRKRNTNRPARRYSQEPNGFLQKASKEKHLLGGFLILFNAGARETAFCFSFCSTSFFVQRSSETPPSRKLADFAAPILPTDYGPSPTGTNWGCSETRIMLETAETGILAFLQSWRRFSQTA